MKPNKSFKVIHNVLSDRERKKIIKDVQPFLMNSEQLNARYNNTILYPGTVSYTHLTLPTKA